MNSKDSEWSRWEINQPVTIKLMGKYVEVAYLYFDRVSINRLKSTGGIFFHGPGAESIRCNSFQRTDKTTFEVRINNMEMR